MRRRASPGGPDSTAARTVEIAGVALPAKMSSPITPFLLVHHKGRERIRRNSSAHISLGDSSRPVRTTTLFFLFSVLLLAGCASDRSPQQHSSNQSIFDSPDVGSLH